ncbi:MAG: hypothetical protein R2736_07345 [Solirubrobacterales bacterium]
MLAARSRGCGIVFLSSDLDELLDLSDTIVILVSGRVSGTVDPKTVSATELGRLIGGAQ